MIAPMIGNFKTNAKTVKTELVENFESLKLRKYSRARDNKTKTTTKFNFKTIPAIGILDAKSQINSSENFISTEQQKERNARSH